MRLWVCAGPVQAREAELRSKLAVWTIDDKAITQQVAVLRDADDPPVADKILLGRLNRITVNFELRSVSQASRLPQ